MENKTLKIKIAKSPRKRTDSVPGKTRQTASDKKLHESQQALRESEQRYRNLVRFAPTGIYDVDFATGRFTEVNEVMCRVLGYTRNELLAMTAFDILDDDGKALFTLRTSRARSGEQLDETSEYRVRTKDGRLVWALLNVNFRRDGKNIVGATVAAHDITERKRAEEALRESEERFKVLSETSPVGMGVVASPEATFMYVNPAYEKAFGYSRDELLGRKSPDIWWNPAERERVVAILKETGTIADYEVRLKRKDGSMFWGLASNKSITYNGRPATLGTFIDITERKRAEESLCETRNYLENLFNYANAPIIVWDPSFRITKFNHAFEHLTGYTADEVVGKEPGMLFPEESKKASLEKINHTVSGWQWEVVEIPILRKDGTTRIALWNSANIYAKDGMTLVATIAQGQDITARKKNEEELAKLNRILRALGKSSQAMMRAVSEPDYLEEVCRIIVEECGYKMAWIGFANDDEEKTVEPVVSAGFEQGYIEKLNITWADTERGTGPTGTAIRTGRVTFCRNMLVDPAFAPWRDEAIRRGYASSIVLPLMGETKAFGAISIYSKEVDPFSEKEIHLLEDLAHDLSYGILTLRLRVARAEAEERQRNERNFINAVIQTTGGLIVGLDVEGRIQLFNRACEKTTGYAFTDIKGRVFWDFLLIPEEQEPVKNVFRKIKQGSFNSEMEFENYWVTRDGERRFIRWANSAIKDEDGNVQLIIGTGIDITERKKAEEEILRTSGELRRSNEELERFNRAMVDRELRMVKLKKEVNELCVRLGEQPRYELGFEEDDDTRTIEKKITNRQSAS